ncbi:unnamed protein product [Triticum turgidum subsp. durum]|uniref:Uncharacterized protein n=1 Tax=Triticum turgidum subsp. durum TaxID=4567 RepID=A0A9R0RGI9_TRITD|nr:unnamed protein product [Triticum turgidum subsp. durum]
MGYLLLSPSPSPPLASRHRCPAAAAGRHRARRGAAVVASCDGGPSSSQAARYALARRAVLLGVSALPLLRDTAAKAAAPSSAGLVTETKDVPKVDEPQAGGTMVDEPQTGGTQTETPLLEAPQPESSLPVVQTQSSGNPLAGLLNAIAVIASGVLAGLYGTSQQEKKALQSVVSSVNHLQTTLTLIYFIILADILV